MQGQNAFLNRGHDMIILSSSLEKRFKETLNTSDSTQTKTVANELNQLFPNLQSFDNAPNVLKEITTDMQNLEQELRELILKKSANPNLMEPIKLELKTLRDTCDSIQSRGTEKAYF